MTKPVQAFPYPSISMSSEGMSLRDYFAGQALCGLSKIFIYRDDADEAALRAYRIADAMMKAREQS